MALTNRDLLHGRDYVIRGREEKFLGMASVFCNGAID